MSNGIGTPMGNTIGSKPFVFSAGGIGGVLGGGSGASVYNPSLPVWTAAAAAVNGGSADARILCVGDSTTIGINATGNTNWPCEYDYVATSLDAVVNSHKDAFFGFSTASGNRVTKDTRIVATGAAIGSTAGLGGFSCQFATAGNNIVFTPTETVDTFRVFWFYNGAVTVSIQATGGTAFAATLNSGSGTQFGTSGLRYVDVTAALLLPGNAVTISKTGGAGTFHCVGIEAKNSTVKQCFVINAGHWGSKTSDWAATNGSRLPLDVINLSPSGYFSVVNIKAGINDANSAVAIATYKANLQSLITAAKGRGADVVLETGNPLGNGTDITPYITALNELAVANNLFLANSFANPFVSYANANANSWMADTLHPNTAGYAQQATVLSDLLIAQGALSFTPSSISGLSLWLDASDTATITQAGGAVSQWNDKSSNAANATQSTGARQPTTNSRTVNSLNVLDFNGTNQCMLLPASLYGIGNGPNTIFVVAQLDSAIANVGFVTGAGGGINKYAVSRADGTSELRVINRTTSELFTTQSYGTTAALKILGFSRSGTSINQFVDGVAGTPGTNSENTTVTDLRIGSYDDSFDFMNGVMCEIIIYNSALSTAQLNLVGNYLKTKWGATWTGI